MVLDYKSIGKRIKFTREEKKISIKDIAQKLEIKENNFTNLEKGDTTISLPNLVKISEILEVSIDYLVMGAEKDREFEKEFAEILAKCTKEQEKFIYEIAELVVQMNL